MGRSGMTKSIEDFCRALDRAMEDPDSFPELMEAAAHLQVAEGAALELVQLRIASALDVLRHRAGEEEAAGRARRGQPFPDADDCLDLIVLSPGGIVQSAPEPGRSWIERLLATPVTLDRRLPLLEDGAVHAAFNAVRDGRTRAQWMNRPEAEICFATTNTRAASEGMLGRTSIVMMVKSVVPRGQRQTWVGDAPLAFDLARIIHRIDPNHPKSPMQWLAATPPRRIFKLPDGRDLTYRVYGIATAKPAMVFSAMNTCTMADPFLANAAIRFGLKLIMIGRPGFGASTPLPTLDFAQVADDAARLAQALDLSETAIFASASATSFAIATAKIMGPKVTRIGLYTPRLGPPQSDKQLGWGRMMRAFARSGWMLDQALRLFGGMMQYRQIASGMLSYGQACPRDKEILLDLRLLDYCVVQLQDAMARAPSNANAEIRLALSGAYEAPCELRQPIAIWYGSENSGYAPTDLDRDFACMQNVQIQPIKGIGIHFGQPEANRMMRWLAEGGDA